MIERPTSKSSNAAIERNIAAVHRVRRDSDDLRRWDHKIVDRIAAFAGSALSLYTHLAAYGICLGWIFYHDPAYGPAFNETLGALSVAGSLEGIFLALFVLNNQRRMAGVERKSSDLHLQTSLLTENEITKLAKLTDLIAKRLGINPDQIQDFDQVKQEVDPDQVLQQISKHESEWPTESTREGPNLRARNEPELNTTTPLQASRSEPDQK